MRTSAELIYSAYQAGVVVPGFNVPYLPMVKPIVQAVVDEDSFALVETARVEWLRFESRGPADVMDEFAKWSDPEHVRLHLDHVPVIDENFCEVDYRSIIKEAIVLGYQSVMVDGSRLDLGENIAATQQVVGMAHEAGIPCEAELGAVLGHEAGPMPPYEELFESGMGFTDVEQARRFVQDTGCDWLSVAIGNIHGAVAGSAKNMKKAEARLDLDHLESLREATAIPFVLHGGSGVKREYMLSAIKRGIAKVNVGTDLRQAYETGLGKGGDVVAAQQAVYDRTRWLIKHYFCVSGTRRLVTA